MGEPVRVVEITRLRKMIQRRRKRIEALTGDIRKLEQKIWMLNHPVLVENSDVDLCLHPENGKCTFPDCKCEHF